MKDWPRTLKGWLRPSTPAPAPVAAPAARATEGDATRRLRLLLDHMPDGVLAFDARGTIEWINPAARAIFQVGAADVIGRSVRDWIDPMPEPANDPGHDDDALTAPTRRQIVTGRRRDGTRFPLEVARVTLPGRRPPLGMCVCRDVSEQQRLARMQREFVSMVSHELRTPLTSLRGALALLTDGNAPPSEREAAYLLGMAHDNAERLVRLVNDILDFEKLRAGALQVEPDDADLGELARQAVQAIDGMARQAGVTVGIVTPTEALPVRVDPHRLLQVLANLLSNAIKHSPRGGTVRISLTRRSEHARLEVADSGPGVPEEFMSRLFEPFQQARDPQRHQQGGTGLGLAISRALMQMMHGAIGLAQSRAQRGAVFWIELPLNTALPSTFFGELDP